MRQPLALCCSTQTARAQAPETEPNERRSKPTTTAVRDVLLSDHDIVEPDLLFFSRERLELLSDQYAQGAPDLVIEILSPSSRKRDLGTKRARYELLGAGEYWVFDTGAKTALVFRRRGESFLPPVRLSAESDDRLTTPLLPGLAIALRKVFPA